MTGALIGDLAAIVGEEHVVIGQEPAIDGVTPTMSARPGDVGQVSRLLALAHARGLAVLPRGAGTALGLGNPPRRVDFVLDLGRLNRITEYEPADVTVSVEAGALLDDLERVLGKQHQFLPFDPPGWRQRTVGGVLATDASGPLRFRYGTARDALLGVRFVQADGTITWGGSRVVKSVTGYDVPKLLTGSLGTLGVLVEVTLRLHPLPDSERSWLVAFPAAAPAGDFLAAVLDSTLQPSRMEVLNGGALGAAGGPEAPVAAAVSIGSVEEAVRAQGEAVSSLAARFAGTARPAPDDFWDGYTAAARVGESALQLRLACLPAFVTATLARLDQLARDRGLAARIRGSAGAGALLATLEGPLAPAEWVTVVSLLREELGREGGSVVIERSPLPVKQLVDVWGPVPPGPLAVMRRLKAEFDPDGVLNPGRFVAGL